MCVHALFLPPDNVTPPLFPLPHLSLSSFPLATFPPYPLYQVNYLKQKYHARSSAVIHRRVWGIIAAQGESLLRLPALQKPLGYVQVPMGYLKKALGYLITWFTAAPGPARG